MLSRVTYFITHRCNLACSYCTTILKENRTLELSAEDTLRAIDKMCSYKPEVVVLTGGEPLVRRDLQEVIDRLNQHGQYYVLITNATYDKVYSLRGLQGLSCSVDVLPWNPRTDELDEWIKSAPGVQVLVWGKKTGLDVTASIVAGHANVQLVPELVRWLSARGIVSYVCVLHAGKEPFWRFRSKDTNQKLTAGDADWLGRELLQVQQDGALLLNDSEYLRLIPQHGADLSWHCSQPKDLVVDSDGSIMTCSDYWGPRCKAMNILSPEFSLWEWAKQWVTDEEECPGCFWQCTFQSESESSSRRPGTRLVNVSES